MSAVLLDVNLLIGLNWQHHPHHRAAIDWFDHQLKSDWASCPMTECGFIRLSSNPRIIPGAYSSERAAALLVDMRERRRGVFWVDDVHPSTEKIFTGLVEHQQVTDAYLIAMARRHRGQLATFDAGLVHLAKSLGLAQYVIHVRG